MHEKDLKRVLHIRISDSDFKELESICEINGIEFSYLIRYILRKFIREINSQNGD